jgi:plastocyanin
VDHPIYIDLWITAPTPAVQPIDHKIIVGPDGQLVYNPANISAAIGDTVTFEFRPKNHTVTQSSFLKPCEPLVNATTGAVGFKSGLYVLSDHSKMVNTDSFIRFSSQPVDANATTFPQFQIKINDVRTNSFYITVVLAS